MGCPMGYHVGYHVGCHVGCLGSGCVNYNHHSLDSGDYKSCDKRLFVFVRFAMRFEWLMESRGCSEIVESGHVKAEHSFLLFSEYGGSEYGGNKRLPRLLAVISSSLPDRNGYREYKKTVV